jgi:hypothetical protein
MNQISECCDAPLVYHIWEKSDGSIGYEPWDFCPQCLDCCSGYNVEQRAIDERLSKILLTDKERESIIGRTIQRIQRENQSLIDDEDSESCGVCTCGFPGA